MSFSDSASSDDPIQRRVDELADQYMRKKEGEQRHKVANVVREASAHIGIETPLTVLVGIRSALEELVRLQMEESRANEIRYNNICTLLLPVSNSANTKTTDTSSVFLGSQNVQSDGKSQGFFHGSTNISSGHHLVGLCIMQLCNVIERYDQSAGYAGVDTTAMSVKDWASVSKLLLSCDSKVTETKGVVGTQKPSSDEFIAAARLVGSSISGRATMCEVAHLHELCRTCAPVASCVAAVLQRLSVCPGIVSAERQMKLSRVAYPFALNEDTLNLKDAAAPKHATVIPRVLKLKHDQKKAYVAKILEKGTKPPVALFEVETAKL